MAKTSSTKRLDHTHYTRDGRRVPAYTPTEEEIAAGCRKINAKWDEDQCRKRAGLEPQYLSEVQIVKTGIRAKLSHNLDS